MSSIKEFMEQASKAYYDGNPIISNEEYDSLEKAHGQIIAGAGDIPHFYRMYSLKKHYDKDGTPPLNIKECIETPKLDGAAVALYYINGVLELALTRGDGIKGRDITEKVKLLVSNKIQTDEPLIQITGEVVALESVENSRNFASGALNLKDIEEFKSRIIEGKIKFVAYNINPCQGTTYELDLIWLTGNGFDSVNIFDHSQYPKDGRVFRLNSNLAYATAGFTDKFPRGAFAWKEEQEVFTTTLLDVVWETGRTGKVTPTAILESVNINGANVARATLNNIEYIEALDLEIGCTVELIRSGEIIPKIVGRTY